MKRWLLLVSSIIFHISTHITAVALLIFFFLPISNWYINHSVILGVDFYNMVSNTSYYSRHFDARYLGYKPINWAGYPYAYDYPSLHFYLNALLVPYFGVQQSTLIYSMLSLFAFGLSSYFLFWVISRNKALSFVLALFSLYSSANWGPIIWGGNLQYVGTMAFLPFTIGLLYLYTQSKTRKFLIVSAAVAGLSVLGHPQILISYISIFVFLIIVFGYFEKIKATIKRRLVDLGIYFGVVLVISYVQLQQFLGSNILYLPVYILNQISALFSRFSGSVSKPDYGSSVSSITPIATIKAIAAYNKQEFWRFLSEVNEIFFVFFAAAVVLLIISVIFAKKRLKVLGVLPFLIFLGYTFVSIYGLSRGIPFFQGGWYRAFWAMPLAFGVCIAYGYRMFWFSLIERISLLDSLAAKSILALVFTIVISVSGYFYFSRQPLEDFIDKHIDTIRFRQKSGVYPDALNKPFKNHSEFENLAQNLVPKWLPVQDHQYRLYSADQKVNIWWPTFYEMPLFRGYNDSPIGSGMAGSYFWTDIALAANAGKDPIIEDFKYPKDIAKNNALYLIDWFSIGYFEGGHERSDSYNPPSSFLLEDKNIFEREEIASVAGRVKVFETKDGKMEWVNDDSDALKFYKFKDGLVSPVASATDASIIGIIGSWESFETFNRSLAMTNTNSQQLITVWLTQSLAEIPSLDNLNLDAVILYGYKNGDNNSGWNKVEKYLKKGGKVFVETGSDVFQTKNTKLPKIFPIEGTKREGLGMSWDLNEFGPPSIDGKEWNFSLPTNLKNNAEVILKTGNTPLIVSGSFEGGKVIWSGMNLFYHANVYKSTKEGEFIRSIVSRLVSLEKNDPPPSQAQFISNRKIKIKSQNAKAVLLRQEFWPVWTAKVNGQTQKILPAGPTGPGFMYVPIPTQLRDKPVEVEFNYQGDTSTLIYTILTIVVSLVILDYLLGGKITKMIYLRHQGKIVNHIGRWWKKEDE